MLSMTNCRYISMIPNDDTKWWYKVRIHFDDTKWWHILMTQSSESFLVDLYVDDTKWWYEMTLQNDDTKRWYIWVSGNDDTDWWYIFVSSCIIPQTVKSNRKGHFFSKLNDLCQLLAELAVIQSHESAFTHINTLAYMFWISIPNEESRFHT